MRLKLIDKIVIWVAVSVIVLMCLFPPWIWASRSGGSGHYGLIFNPPDRHEFIDYDRLWLQIGVVVLVGAAVMVTSRRGKPL